MSSGCAEWFDCCRFSTRRGNDVRKDTSGLIERLRLGKLHLSLTDSGALIASSLEGDGYRGAPRATSHQHRLPPNQDTTR
ncbi:protein of unknown function [Methylorubrum extorquens]|uniref:Uncharacterized protein n=1 Tax=Methylorubrum extorquens TaxID=408 RepID=A0A2N9AL63_METEX|nr:protein of unknown function [Methylorubrum extorquens]